jgi:hypothetical protein
MATAPIPTGGIVSVPDPVTGGAGAPVVVSQIVNAKWANSIALLNASSARNDIALAITDPAPQLHAPTLDTTFVQPIKPILPDNNPADGKAMFDDANAVIGNQIQSAFSGFFAQYFPNVAYFNGAQAWLEHALTTGGTGINTGVEQHLWERARARILADSARAEDEAMSNWANRGFPLPPGALTNQINQINLDAGRKLAEQSRDISIESFRAELENTRLAVDKAINLRISTLTAAGDYIKTIILGPQTAMQLTTGLAGLRTDLARSMVQMYTAESAALDPRIRLSIADADLKMRGEEANLRARSAAIDARVRAAMQGADQVAHVAAASLNGISASAGISGTD